MSTQAISAEQAHRVIKNRVDLTKRVKWAMLKCMLLTAFVASYETDTTPNPVSGMTSEAGFLGFCVVSVGSDRLARRKCRRVVAQYTDSRESAEAAASSAASSKQSFIYNASRIINETLPIVAIQNGMQSIISSHHVESGSNHVFQNTQLGIGTLLISASVALTASQNKGLTDVQNDSLRQIPLDTAV